MPDREQIEAALEKHSGQPFKIASQQAIGGGCINDAYRLQNAGGQSYFVKANTKSFYTAFAAEARALREIAATNTVRVPKVIALIDGSSQAYLILEYIEPRPSQSGDWQALARQLAQLHRIKQPHFGWTQDNLIGATDRKSVV